MIDKPLLGEDVYLKPGLSDGLVGCWLMNEGSVNIGGGNTIRDLSGNGNHATFVNDTHFVVGRFGTAVDFDGTGDYATIGDNSTIDLAGSFTLLAWIRPENITTQQRIIAKNASYYFEINSSKLRTYLYGLSYQGYHTSANAPVINTWQQVAVTYDGAKVRFFFDGLPDGSAVSASGNITNTANALTFGGVGVSQPYNGQIDHILMFNRALTASEIALLCREPFFMFERDDILWQSAAGAGVTVPIMYHHYSKNLRSA